MITRFDSFVNRLSEVDLYWHRLAAGEMAKFGLKGNWAVYFTRLYRHPDGLTNTELIRICSKDKSDVSKDIRNLEEMGYVIKKGKTQYRQKLVLTEKGIELTDNIVNRAKEIVSFISSDINENDRIIFYKVFDDIIGKMKDLSEDLHNK